MFIDLLVQQTLAPFGGAEPTLDTSFNLISRSSERRKRMMSLVAINMAHLRCEDSEIEFVCRLRLSYPSTAETA